MIPRLSEAIRPGLIALLDLLMGRFGLESTTKEL